MEFFMYAEFAIAVFKVEFTMCITFYLFYQLTISKSPWYMWILPTLFVLCGVISSINSVKCYRHIRKALEEERL